MGASPKPERWLELAEQLQKQIDINKPWITIDSSSYRGVGNTVKYYCSKHDHSGSCSGATIKKNKGCPQCQTEGHYYKTPEYQESRRQLEAEKFIVKAKEVHGDKYEYHVEWYESRNDALTKIWCNKHNDFFYQRPAAHIQGQNCPECGKEANSLNSRVTEEDFIAKVSTVNKNPNIEFTDCGYTRMHDYITFTCAVHGKKRKKANNVLHNEQPCEECNTDRRRSEGESSFISQGKILHNDVYDYSLIQGLYVDNRTKLPVRCKVHDIVFYTSRNHHIDRLQACPECAKSMYGRWNLECLKKNIIYHANKACCVYLIKFESGQESFYKIGMTTDMKVRLKLFADEMPTYIISTIQECWSDTIQSVILEKRLQKEVEFTSYRPVVKFGGYTECFKLSPDQLLSITSTLSSPA